MSVTVMTAADARAELDRLTQQWTVAMNSSDEEPGAGRLDQIAAAETALAEHWDAVANAACQPGGVLAGVHDIDLRSLLIAAAVSASSNHRKVAAERSSHARWLRRQAEELEASGRPA